MSKTAQKFVEQETSQLVRKFGGTHRSPELNQLLEKDYQRIAKRLMKYKISSLITLYNESWGRYNEIREVSLRTNETKAQVDPELEIYAEFQTAIYKTVIEMKRVENRSQPKHPIANTLVDYGLFSASTPNKSSIQKDFGNTIVQQREGLNSTLYTYTNKHAVFLESFDAKVFIGLTKMWFDQGKNPKIKIESLGELINSYEGIISGGEIKTVRESLRNIQQTIIVMKECFDPSISEIIQVTDEYSPIERITWYLRNGEKEGEETAATIELSNTLHTSMLEGNYSFINMVLYNDLNTPTAKILYMTMIRSVQLNSTLFEVDSLINQLRINSKVRKDAVNNLLQAFEELKDNNIVDDFEPIHGKRNKIEYIKLKFSDWFQNQKHTETLKIG
ncbi:hypothetical protein SAMN04487897_1313 [Paenibacillus sp. yr247]|uniref:hypothetical protein n=1 Tax=Paenibacillus sp. yr247 TaxID=1761880 RepID=UPI000891AF67|nr:hypothetical protein [Paenibacillus sp. yr247]SDP01700.1 hypothetical protein SAMN04487897_1313 [Paenibacillus sp. yr247]